MRNLCLPFSSQLNLGNNVNQNITIMPIFMTDTLAALNIENKAAFTPCRDALLPTLKQNGNMTLGHG